MAEELTEKVNGIIQKEFDNFYKNVISNWQKEQIFNNAFEINARTEIAGFFDCTELSDEQYLILIAVEKENNGHLTDMLCEFFVNHEYASVNSYEDIEKWIGWFCEKEEREFNGKN